MIRDCIPFPNPSNAPDAVIEKVEKRKPRLMMRSAVCPIRIVSGFVVKRPIRRFGITRQMIVPKSMIIPFMIRTIR